MHYTDYLAIENWEVIDTKTCHFFNEDATPFEAICFRIGTLTTFKTTIHGSEVVKSPIIRWVSRAQYETLKKNSGVVVF